MSTLGFNGEYLDDTLDNYHLGNGYRAYNPITMQFTAPDDMSPFGHGGINPYVYCSGDPINNTDPTGHFGGFLGVVIGVINMVSPIQVPTELTLGAAEEAVVGTVVNVGVDLATDGIGAVATPVLRSVEGVVRSTTEHAIEGDVEHAAILNVDAPVNKKFNRQKIPPLSKRFKKQRSISPESVYELQRSKSGRFLLRNPNGETKVPEDDLYIYVIRTDRDVINVAKRTKFRPPNGHTSLTRLGGTGDSYSDYQSVYYAGEIKFNENPKEPPFWNNYSGHYTPPAELRHTNFTAQQRELLLPDKWRPKWN